MPNAPATAEATAMMTLRTMPHTVLGVSELVYTIMENEVSVILSEARRA